MRRGGFGMRRFLLNLLFTCSYEKKSDLAVLQRNRFDMYVHYTETLKTERRMVDFSSSYESYWCGSLETGPRKVKFCLNTGFNKTMSLIRIKSCIECDMIHVYKKGADLQTVVWLFTLWPTGLRQRVASYWHFGGMCCRCLQGSRVYDGELGRLYRHVATCLHCVTSQCTLQPTYISQPIL
jgi:hypothetical protein